ncbi:hypothetical protein BpHYR1_024540 [Brachionus plicatilis]|uniref:Uncharacterized protein n=1 Tax=Brachionus plicatilis TaxID=10195 RepID=A0A3M7RYT6_BRAPC|nr:hypothetical protein BpHYR1_024540 [Brachionus plicatilis]
MLSIRLTKRSLWRFKHFEKYLVGNKAPKEIHYTTKPIFVKKIFSQTIEQLLVYEILSFVLPVKRSDCFWERLMHFNKQNLKLKN